MVFSTDWVHLDTTVGQEDLKTIPVPMDIAERLAEPGPG